MPWKATDVMEQRITFIVQAVKRERAFNKLCREFGINRATGYRWLRRYKEVGNLFLLKENSRRPHQSPFKTPSRIEDRVVALRKRYGWGGKKLQILLADEGIELSTATANRIIRRNGLIDQEDSHPPALTRFEKSRPNELWQMDFKGDFVSENGRCFPLSILDDHSRYAVGLHAVFGHSREEVLSCLIKTFERYGVPEGMLMDHGSPWWTARSGLGLTKIGIHLIKQGINLYFSGIRHPQTQGKVERFHRTLKKSIHHRDTPKHLKDWAGRLEEFREEYNHIRPHEAIGMIPPAKRYQPSTRAYQTNPKEWEYPMGSLLRKINRNGEVQFKKNFYFVSTSLTGETVNLEEFDNKLLVTYRHMTVREIDLKRRHSFDLILPITERRMLQMS